MIEKHILHQTTVVCYPCDYDNLYDINWTATGCLDDCHQNKQLKHLMPNMYLSEEMINFDRCTC